MSNYAIVAENISKQFYIGGSQPYYQTFRDSLVDLVTAPAKRIGQLLQGNMTGASELTESFWALQDISFEVKYGEVVGIIGRNGAGKSTLLKILSRITEPTKGRVTLHGRVGALLEVGTGFHPELTGRENIFLNGAILGMSRREIGQKFDEIVAFAEVEKFIDTPAKHYSSGMFMRLAFAVAAHLEPEILIIDEVLAVGDAEFQRKCLGKMSSVAKEGRTVLFVSHNIGAVQNLCNHGIVLNQGQKEFDGEIQNSIVFYNNLLATGGGSVSEPHILYSTPPHSKGNSDFAVTRVEVLDKKGEPHPYTSTWDDISLQITIAAKRPLQRAQLELNLVNYEGNSLAYIEREVDLLESEQSFICRFKQLPLAAGEYTLRAGLTVPNIAWLWPMQDVGMWRIVENDVYGTGKAPVSPRTTLALDYSWGEVTNNAYR